MSTPGRARTGLGLLLGQALAPAVFAIVAVAFLWMSTDPIPALTPDSVQYLNAAQNLAGGYGFVTSATSLETTAPRVPFTDWPPLYPLLLALGAGAPPSGEALPEAPVRWARWLNLLVLAASFFPLAYLASVMAGPRGIVPVLAFYAVFRPIQLVHSFAWSEGLFMLLTLLSWAALIWAIERSTSRRTRLLSLLLSGSLAALVMCTRYIGVAVAAAGAIAIILRTESSSGRRTVGRLLAYLAPAGLPIGLWLLRNFHVTGHAFGAPRGAAGLAPEEVLLGTLRTIATDWICPLVSPHSGAARWTVFLGLGAFVGASALALQRYGPQTMESRSERLSTSVLLMAYTVVYVGVLAVSAGVVAYDPLNWRLFAPVYPAWLLLCAGLLRGAYVDGRTPAWQRRVILASGTIMLGLNALATTTWVTGPREDRSLSWPYWRSLSINAPGTQTDIAVALTGVVPRDAVIVTNTWEAVSLYAGRPAKPVPGRAEPEAMERVLSHEGAYVLAREGYRPDRLGTEDFEAAACTDRLQRIEARGGVHLYRIGHAPGR